MLEPRNRCQDYVLAHGGEAEQLLRVDFDKLADADFADGPFVDTFGDGHGEPYRPFRQAFGTLRDGRVVWCELVKAKEEAGG